MDKLVKIDATVVSHSGMGYSENEDNFFLNGRYMHEYERDNIQITLEKQGEEYIFAVCDGMDRSSNEKSTSISMMKELKKFSDKIKGTGGDLASKLVQIKEKVEEVDNVIYSMGIGNQTNMEKTTAFGGIFILDGKVAALSSGSTRVYQLRDGNIKLMTGESKKAERLLKLGIITSEQAKSLSAQVAASNGSKKNELHKSDAIDVRNGDVFLICSDGVTNSLEDENLHEIMSMNKDSSYIANLMVKEALKKGEKDNITALIVKVEDAGGESRAINRKEKPDFRNRARKTEAKENEGSRTVMAAVIACIVVIGVLITVFYRTWMDDSRKDSDGGSTITSGVTSTGEPEGTQEEGTSAGDALTQNGDNEPQSPEGDGKDQEPDGDKAGNGSDESEAEGEIEHIVKSGDTLQGISKKYYGTLEKYEAIMKRNGLSNPNQLKIGQVLIIPKE